MGFDESLLAQLARHRCLRSSEAKLRRLRDAHQCTLRELDNAKELIAISDEFRAAALSPVQVDDMLNV